MIKIRATKLLGYTTEHLWDILDGQFILIFEDGELEVTAKETLYSSYGWDMIRAYPKTPLLKKHHLKSVIGDNRLASKTHLHLLRDIAWSVYDTYITIGRPDRNDIAKMIYDTANVIYNEMSTRCEEYVVSFDLSHFTEISLDPELKQGMNELQPTEESIGNHYKLIDKKLSDPNYFRKNPIAEAYQAGIVNKGQVFQCIGPRGFVTDIDSVQVRYAVLASFTEGIRDLHDLMIESRSASKALIFSKAPLQDTEYFSRRLQLLCQTVQNLHHTDCGSTNYLTWNIQPEVYDGNRLVKPSDLKLLEGKYYLDTQTNSLKALRITDKHLIGKTLKIRSVIAGCNHEDPYGLCSVCFGELSNNVPEDSNIGHLCCTTMASQSSQNVLSTKHLDANVSVEDVPLAPEMMGLLKVSKSGNGYMLSEKLKVNGHRVNLRVLSSECSSITDINEVPDISALNILRLSEMTTMSIELINKDGESTIYPLEISVNRRKASFTYSFLKFIKQKKLNINEKGIFIFDMTDWDYTQELVTLPMKHFNMSDHSDEIASLIESSVARIKSRDNVQNPQSVLTELCGLVNSKLNVNLAVLEVTLYGACVQSIEDKNFLLPKGWTTKELGVGDITIENRSLAPAMAYEDHKRILTSPASFNGEFRTDHPMDIFLTPREAVEANYARIGKVSYKFNM